MQEGLEQGVGTLIRANRGEGDSWERMRSVIGGGDRRCRWRRARSRIGVDVGDPYQAFIVGERGRRGQQGVGTPNQATRGEDDDGKRMRSVSGGGDRWLGGRRCWRRTGSRRGVDVGDPY